MPLPPPAARRHVHTRKVQCEGFLREDGLWDVEASLIDDKPYAYDDFERGRRQPGEPVHKMSIRLTVDDHLVVREAAAAMDDVPYPTCHDVPPRIEALVGMKLGGGWRTAVRERLPKRSACTHLTELIGPAITTLFQSMSARAFEDGAAKETHAQKPYFVDGCWSWRSDGPALRKFFPQFVEEAK
ncbi:MAG TPA: DUF2889 domain-containing protein [Rhodoblastus sp.]|nr:DUF2889 domain-containing protein [Rhodoblastus sp.]